MTNYHMAALADLKRAIENDNTIDLALIDSLFDSAEQMREKVSAFLYNEIIRREMFADDGDVRGFELGEGEWETRIEYDVLERRNVVNNLITNGLIPIEMKSFRKAVTEYTLVIRHK